MKISNVKIDRNNRCGDSIGFASITFSNDLFLNSISIFEKPDGGYRIEYPTESTLDPNHYWVFRPLSLSTHNIIENAILKELKK